MDNTSSDAMLARKDGMSYGQWKVLHPNTREDREPIVQGIKCLHCGETFIPRKNQKYCQFYCQNAAAILRMRARKEMDNT